LRGEQPDGDGLDLVMRLLWQRHRDTGYTDDDIFGAIAEVSNGTIASRIKSRVALPGLGDRNEFADALSNLGLTLTSTQPPAGWLGVQLAGHTPTVGVRLAATLRDGPAWAAGLTGNDTLLAINDTVVTADTFNQIVEQHQPGDTVSVRVLRHNRIDAVPLTLAHCPATFTVTATTDATALARGSYARWLKLPPS
jgi:predicted metalloprotease with PDZ domain